jgi:hypothetical protein
MKCLAKIAACLAGALMLTIGARADDAIAPGGNPFAPIVMRNVFGLNPPQAVTNTISPDDMPLKITPNGIMSIFGQLQVLFKVAPKPGQTPPAKEQTYVLSEGQSQDDIEVTHINEKDGIVTFNNRGTVQEIPLSTAPALNTPMPAPAGGPPGQNFPAPGTTPRFGGRPGGGPGGPGGRFGAPASSPVNNNGMGGNPAFNAAPASTRGQQQQSTLSAEDQQLLMVAQHVKAVQEGDPAASIFPPTSLDGEAGLPPVPGVPSTGRSGSR